MNSLFIFRNDLRLTDNTALIEASKNSHQVIPIFIFNEEQVDSSKNEFHNSKIIAFMVDSLKELKTEIEERGGCLNFFYGKNLNVIETILKQSKNIATLHLNCDYTTFSIKRDWAIKELCDKNGVQFNSFHDRTLHEPGKVLKPDDTPYTVFTPYYKKAKTLPVGSVNDFKVTNFSNEKLRNQFWLHWEEINEKLGM